MCRFMRMSSRSKKFAAPIALLLALLATIRIVHTYHWTAQAFDEPCHVAAGIEFLAKGTYTLDPVHPPLARIAIGLPLYLFGERYPQLPESDPASHNYNVVGNAVLYGSGHYLRNLFLARIAVLPFFLLATAVVFFWAKSEFGAAASIIAVFVFTTIPTVLAFSGLAYSDIVAASTQSLAFFALARWLRDFNRKSTALLGGAFGLAIFSKFTSFLFLASSCACMLAVWLFFAGSDAKTSAKLRSRSVHLLAAVALALLILWAGYRFSFGHVQQAMGVTSESMPSFQHFPSLLRHTLETAVRKNVLIPAPELLHGLAEAWVLNKSASQSYLFGPTTGPGPWYFFLLVVTLKLPIPSMILIAVGAIFLAKSIRVQNWGPLMPAAACAGVFLITLPVSYKVGVRHVLVVFPLFSILAGAGGEYLLSRLQWRGAALLAVILGVQAVNSLAAQPDPLSYFNLFAGKDPSKVVVLGCDLDCGQDLFRLADALRERHVDHFKLAIWSSADMSKSGLPPFEVLPPFARQTGWIAVSMRSLRMGDVLHESYPPGSFDWLNQYQPVAQVGKTVRLYHITPD
jgi:MFS family permease